ncbi:MAG: hypothetical protein HY791_38145 [Deltaproteobacteria bacterium]|nr:hypothetical protein [Deltaproteobacteria bacterium]
MRRGLWMLALCSTALADEQPDCRATLACEYYGRCEYDGARCVATSDEDCRSSIGCKEDGHCGRDRRTGSCVLDDLGCNRRPECALEGLCGARDGVCAPRVSSDCERSLACRREGRCFGALDGMSCAVHGVTNEDACAKSELCAERGGCSASVDESTRTWVCAPDAASACERSEACRSEGLCTLKMGTVPTCTAVTDAECAKSKACAKGQRCFVHAGRCVDRAQKERREVSSFEALLGPDVRDMTPEELRDEVHFGSPVVVQAPGGPTSSECRVRCSKSCLDNPSIRGNEFEEPKCEQALRAHFEAHVFGRLIRFTNVEVDLGSYEAESKSFRATLEPEPGDNIEGRPVVTLMAPDGAPWQIDVPLDPAHLVSFRRDADEFLRAEVVGRVVSSFAAPVEGLDPTSRRPRRIGARIRLEVLGARLYDGHDGRVIASDPASVLPLAATPTSFELARLRPPEAEVLVLMSPCLDPAYWPRRGCPHLKDRFGGRLYFVSELCPHGACPLAVDEAGSLGLPGRLAGKKIHHARVAAGRLRIVTDHFPADRRRGIEVDLPEGQVVVLELEDDTKTFRPVSLAWSREHGALAEP